jgi:V/A-type H+-transporting ATPase subunit I
MERLEPWGDFKLETIETLKSQGLAVVLCKGNDAKFKEAMSLENLCCREISCGAGFHYFVLVGTGAVDEEKFPGLQLASDDDPALLRSSFERCEAKLENFEKELAELSRSRKALEEMIASYKSAFEFQQAVDALSEAGAVVYLTGFVPEPDIEVLRHAASANGWGLVVSDPGENENVPVLLQPTPGVVSFHPSENVLWSKYSTICSTAFFDIMSGTSSRPSMEATSFASSAVDPHHAPAPESKVMLLPPYERSTSFPLPVYSSMNCPSPLWV